MRYWMIIVQSCWMVTVNVDVVLTKHLQLICILEKSIESVFVYKTSTTSYNQYLLPCSSFRTDVGFLKVRLLCKFLPSMYRDLLQLLQTQLTKFTESLLLLVNRAHRRSDNLVTPAPVQIIHLPDSSPKLTSYFALRNPVSSFGVCTLLTYK